MGKNITGVLCFLTGLFECQKKNPSSLYILENSECVMFYSVATYAVFAFTDRRKRGEKESEGEREASTTVSWSEGFRERRGAAGPRKNTRSVTFASPQHGGDV